MRVIDWNSNESVVLVNPRLPMEEQIAAYRYLPHRSPWTGQIWLATSGSQRRPHEPARWVALSKRAFLLSAAAVNRHLESDSSDCWLHPLPNFHVAGLGIWARSHLTGCDVVFCGGGWNALLFTNEAWSNSVTLTAMVPAQLYDLVATGCQAPPSLRASIIGGGRLDETLYMRAKALGWKPLPSYGLTECASQVATAALDSTTKENLPPLYPLNHVSLALNQEGRLLIQSEALLTGYAYLDDEGASFADPKDEKGCFLTEDYGELSVGTLKILGRGSDFIKIAGESGSLPELIELLNRIKLQHNIKGEQQLLALPHPRKGAAIHMATAAAPEDDVNLLFALFNSQALPPFRIEQIHRIEALPKGALGKIKREELHRLCEQK